MSLETRYLGLALKSPLVVSASPISEEIDHIKRCEEAGAAAVVVYSLFEEQLQKDRYELYQNLSGRKQGIAEALGFGSKRKEFPRDPEEHLNHIRKAKAAVQIPIIASLNGNTLGGWMDFAKKIEEAGADALELNLYDFPADPGISSDQIEKNYLEIVRAVREKVKLPLALKLSPYFTNVGYMAKQFEAAGADGLVLFNRFYQPDIDLDALEVRPDILLSGSHAMRLPMHWIAVLFDRVRMDLAATSGIHTGEDVVKMIMAGANVTMLCSILLSRGIAHLSVIEQELKQWMEKHKHESVDEMRGCMSQKNCSNPDVFERVQYIHSLHSYKFEKK